MRIKPDCIPCILKMTLGLLREIPVSENEIRSMMAQVIALPALSGHDWETTSPLVIESIMRQVTDLAGNPDPFSSAKGKQNERMAAIYPEAKRWVLQSASPLETAVKLAITGNAIDFMVAGGPSDLFSFIRHQLTIPISQTHFSQFTRQLAETDTVVYFSDNCGEILLDKLLIETIKAAFPGITVYVVVRSMPALNDVTLKEALSVGIDSIATVMENGMDGPVPGTVLSRCSPEVRLLVERAGLIIAKGGGNFETMSEDSAELPHGITFMLLAKCVPLARQFGTALQSPILMQKTA